jgi:hypothetical protein
MFQFANIARPWLSPKLRRWRQLALAAVVIASLGATVGDVLYVNRFSVPIRSGKFAFDKVVGTAVQGDALTVAGADGKWLKVKYTPKSDDPSKPAPLVEGFVLDDALSARQVAAATGGPTGSASEVASAGASRGLLDSGKYATVKGLNPDPFYRMVTDSRAAISDKSFDEFTQAGKIGPHKPNAVAMH